MRSLSFDHFGGDPFECLDRGVGIVAAQVEHDPAGTDLFESSDFVAHLLSAQSFTDIEHSPHTGTDDLQRRRISTSPFAGDPDVIDTQGKVIHRRDRTRPQRADALFVDNHANPAITLTDRPVETPIGVAMQPEWRVRALNRRWHRANAACRKSEPFTGDVLTGPHLFGDFDRLLESLTAIVRIDTESVELGLQVTGPHPKRDAAFAEVIECCHLVSGDERISIRREQHPAEQPNRRGDGSAEPERREQVGYSLAPGVDPATRRSRVVGERDRVVTNPFGGDREPLRLTWRKYLRNPSRVPHPVLYAKLHCMNLRLSEMTDADKLALAAKYATASRTNDADALRALCAEGALTWHNFDEVEVTTDQTVRTVAWLHRAVPDLAWVDVALKATSDGWVSQTILTGTAPGGALRAHSCVVVTLDADGKVARTDEYLDPAQTSVLRG